MKRQIDNQRGRRNLSAIDRIALEAKREEIVARVARAQQVSTLKRGDFVPAKLPKREPISTRAVVAKAAGGAGGGETMTNSNGHTRTGRYTDCQS